MNLKYKYFVRSSFLTKKVFYEMFHDDAKKVHSDIRLDWQKFRRHKLPAIRFIF